MMDEDVELEGDDLGDELDELLSGDDVEIVGARRGRRRRKIRRQRRRLQTVYAGIPRVEFTAALESQTVIADVAEPFRPERLVLSAIDTSGASPVPTDDVEVASLVIGTISQAQNGNPVPLIAFNPDAVGVRLRGTTAQPGVGITLTLANGAGTAVTVRGVFIGPALTP